MKKLSFDDLGEFKCYRIDEILAAKGAKEKGENVMVARPCVKCGDLLFGCSLDPNLEVCCEEGYHHSRPGVFV